MTTNGTNSEYLYVDGQLAAESGSATTAPGFSGEDFWIGGDPDPGVFQFFTGVIDEVAMFTNSLSAGQILWLFSTGENVTHLNATIGSTSRSTLALTWLAIPGQTYSLEYSTNLAQNHWLVLDKAILATNSTVTVSNAVGAGGQQFYRVVLVP